jgi:hypothetical protein
MGISLGAYVVADPTNDGLAIRLEEHKRVLRVETTPCMDQVFALLRFHRMNNGDTLRIDQGRIAECSFGR